MGVWGLQEEPVAEEEEDEDEEEDEEEAVKVSYLAQLPAGAAQNHLRGRALRTSALLVI